MMSLCEFVGLHPSIASSVLFLRRRSRLGTEHAIPLPSNVHCLLFTTADIWRSEFPRHTDREFTRLRRSRAHEASRHPRASTALKFFTAALPQSQVHADVQVAFAFYDCHVQVGATKILRLLSEFQ
jgi:hypothetical protein